MSKVRRKSEVFDAIPFVAKDPGKGITVLGKHSDINGKMTYVVNIKEHYFCLNETDVMLIGDQGSMLVCTAKELARDYESVRTNRVKEKAKWTRPEQSY
jgi:hypothetical protein